MQLQISIILVIILMAAKSTLQEAYEITLSAVKRPTRVTDELILTINGVSGNLALHARTSISSKWLPDTSGNKAVDGRIDATGLPMHSCSGTMDPDPYWYVDIEVSYLVQTVEIISRRDCCLQKMDTIEVRVGEKLNDDNGMSNPLCGEPADLDDIPEYIFRCEIYGRYVTIKRAIIPATNPLMFLEVMVNKEPTTNIAFKKPTRQSGSYSTSSKSENVVDGLLNFRQFVSRPGVLPHWLMIDFEETKKVAKIFVLPRGRWVVDLNKIILTLGDDSTDNGKHNKRIGGIHDFSKAKYSSVYLLPRGVGRYFYFESLVTATINLYEIEVYSESMPHISLRTNGVGTHARTFYQGNVATLSCPAVGYPKPHVAWVRDGVLLQNTTTQTYLKWTVNDTIGTVATYGCYATNVHGKDYYPIAVTVAGRYSMCIKPEEIRDPTRNRFSKQDSSLASQSDATTFDQNKMYTFFNPQSSRYMKLTTSCPPPSSCATSAPGWLADTIPNPEDGIKRRKVCFHYNGDCCYKALYISIINCPGMYVYGLVNTVEFDFPARYCFEDDKYLEAFAPFRSVPLLFGAVGGTNNALVNHVIAKESGIEDTSQCLTVCLMNKCRSFNFAKLEKICEVSDVTRDEYPRDLSSRSGFQYYHPMKQPIVVDNGFN